MILDYIESSEYIVARVTFQTCSSMAISDEVIEDIVRTIRPSAIKPPMIDRPVKVTAVLNQSRTDYTSVFDNYLIDYQYIPITDGGVSIRGAIVCLANRRIIRDYQQIDHKKLATMVEVVTQGRYDRVMYEAFWLKQESIPHPDWFVVLDLPRRYITEAFVLCVSVPNNNTKVPDTIKIGNRVYTKSDYILPHEYTFSGNDTALTFEIRVNQKYYSLDINSKPPYHSLYQEYIHEIIRAHHIPVTERRLINGD